MTIDALIDYYPWIKAFHVISMVAWMAGLFYLPRLYVYHCDLQLGSVESERFKLMEYRLLKQIMNPAMIATWTFGLLLVMTPGVVNWASGWWHMKLFCVILMTAFHMALGPLAQGFHARRQQPARPVLSDRQRVADGADGHYRHHGDREAFQLRERSE